MQLASKNVFCSMWQLEDIIFSQSLSSLWDFFNRHIVVFFETSALKEVRILSLLSPFWNNFRISTITVQH